MPGPSRDDNPRGGSPRGGGSRGGSDRGGNRDNSSREGKGFGTILRYIAMALVVIVAVALFAFKGCSVDLSGVPALGNLLSGGQSQGGGSGGGLGGLFSAKHVSDTDRKNFATVQDVNGNVFTTVVEVIPVNTPELDQNDLKARIANYRYYQAIMANNMGTGTQEKAYVYFPQDVTLTELWQVANTLSADGIYATKVLTPDEYQAYVNSIDPNNLYYNETTFYGPAATGK